MRELFQIYFYSNMTGRHERFRAIHATSLFPSSPPSTLPIVRRTFFVYLIFFLGRSWLEWPHLRLRQLVALGGRRACIVGTLAYQLPLRFFSVTQNHQRVTSEADSVGNYLHSTSGKSSYRSCTSSPAP
jgi:hypothetical protein